MSHPEATATATLLSEWSCKDGHEWYCYWSNEFGPPEDPIQNYVFSPPLVQDQVVTAVNMKPSMASTDIQNELLELQKRLCEQGTTCGGNLGSESDYNYFPFLVNWDADRELTPSNFLVSLGAHQKLIESIEEISAFNSSPPDEQQPFGDASETIFRFLRRGTGQSIAFCAGKDMLNPVPLFVVGNLGPTLVGGFISALIHT